MEKERDRNNKIQSDSFTKSLEKAQNGDKEAIQEILDTLEPDIKKLSKFIRLPKEDATQFLKVELINIVKNILRIQK